VVLAMPRGGVPVGYEIARALRAPLDLLIVRKLGVPGREELAMGAIASGGCRVLNEQVVRELRIPADWIELVTAQEEWELARRERLYRGLRPTIGVRHKTAILVDDGLATGATMRAAVESLRLREPSAIIAAVPVGAPESCAMLSGIVDRMICLEQPVDFAGVGRYYRDFRQITDEEVRALFPSEEQGTLHSRP
jgi:predicted phosphoribosyltransferase